MSIVSEPMSSSTEAPMLRRRYRRNRNFAVLAKLLGGSGYTIRLPYFQHELDVAESLPAGSGEDWLCWRALNRQRTGVGRAKTVMRRWGYLDYAQSVDCDCGEPQTMAHLLSCRLLDEACTADGLATVTDRAKACARKREKIV